MNRRNALSTSAALLGGALLSTTGFLDSCARIEKKMWSWSESDIKFLDAIGETILPSTSSSPGARDAGIGEYMKVMVTECFDEGQQKLFMDGIASLEELSHKKYGKNFLELSGEEKHELLALVDEETRAYNAQRKPGDPRHYFSVVKNLAMEGFFTSEPGATRVLQYVPIPARYDGCIEYTTGTPAWAS